jgi:hypothetical protein
MAQAPAKTTSKTLSRVHQNNTMTNRIKKQRQTMIGASAIQNKLKSTVQ